ncbi:MAG: HNH endonuclease [Microbacterium sp.]|nr:MAG: HNH endonuclease [Microbacterium sp.]
MSSPIHALSEAVAALAVAWPGERVEGCEAARLVEMNRLVGQVRRLADAAAMQVASEIARQSRPELGADLLAKRQGHRNATTMLATTLGTTTGEAAKLVEVGVVTAPQLLLTGEAAPARHPFVADAVTAGRIGRDAAAAIIRMLDGVCDRVGPAGLDEAEKLLVERAEGLELHAVQKLLLRAEAHLDPDGVEPKEDDLRARTFLSVRQDASGGVALKGLFDPARGAVVLNLIEAMVTVELGEQRDAGTKGNGLPPRPIPEMQADALIAVCEHYTGCGRTDEPLPGATVIVRVTLDDLQAGTGVGLIDGLDQPVSIGTVRRVAADGGVIPWVMGGKSEILDWGRRKRLFTRAQKRAITTRDGGCIGCGAPPGRSKVHHIDWWRHGGKTDCSNGCLLCDSCHHLVHDQGWEIRIDGEGVDAAVWLIPPPHVDPGRTPRPAAARRVNYGPAA